MQKISKKNDGITLIALIITIILILVLVAVTINYSITTINESKNDKVEGELSMVQASLIQQYVLMQTKEKDGKIATEITEDVVLKNDVGRPQELVGTRLATLTELISNDFTEYLVDYTKENMTYEEYYYLLNEEDLQKLGILNDSVAVTKGYKRVYIVNYSTGEVFDMTNKKYYVTEENSTENGNSIYINGTINSKSNQTTYNFTDE